MATRSGSADDDRPTYLAPGFAAAVVAAALDDRIAKGRDLLAQIDVHVYPQPGRADEVNGKYWAWFNYNATYLERAFTTKELRTEFEGVFIGGTAGARATWICLRLRTPRRGRTTSKIGVGGIPCVNNIFR